MTHAILVADIGGTNARFALYDAEQDYRAEATLPAADYPHLADAIDAYLQLQGLTTLGAIVLAVAGPIVNQSVDFPNSHWAFSQAELQQKYAAEVVLLNDWEAMGYSLSRMTDEHVIAIGGDWPIVRKATASFSAIGPGSGLGVGGCRRVDGRVVPIVSEGGHTSFAPVTELQLDLFRCIQQRVEGRISAERLLSGPGILTIYHALCDLNNAVPQHTSAAAVTTTAWQGDAVAAQAMALFFEILGQTAGDVALVQGGFDGVFLGGGICQRFPEQLAASLFRQGFENKGRHQFLMASIPTWLITHPNPGLLGTTVAAERYC